MKRLMVRGSTTRKLTPSGPTSSGGIVLESVRLKTREESHGFSVERRWEVHGIVRNDGANTTEATIAFRAYDPRDAVIGVSTPVHVVLAPGERVPFTEIFLDRSGDFVLNDCDRVHRFDARIDARAVG